MSGPLATSGRQSRSVPCVDFMYPLALTRQLENVGVRAHSPASERQQEDVLTAHARGFGNATGGRNVLTMCIFWL